VGLDVGEFYGESQPGGPITRDKLIRYYPRIFNPKEKRGWTIWTVGLHGKALTEIIEGVAASGIFFNLDGLTYTKTYDKTGKLKLKDFRIHGKWVNPVKRYKVAVSEGLGLGSKRANWFARAYFRPRNTGIFVWEAVEAQLRALRVAESPSSVRQ
jgi:hypothetical protein